MDLSDLLVNEGKILPLDEELDALLEEIKKLDGDIQSRKKKFPPISTGGASTQYIPSIKKPDLFETEKTAYFELNHYFKLTLMSIDDAGTALEIWIKAVLPHLLQKHALTTDEWERICNIGDKSDAIEQELDQDWLKFYKEIIRTGQVDEMILGFINEGKKRVEKMRE